MEPLQLRSSGAFHEKKIRYCRIHMHWFPYSVQFPLTIFLLATLFPVARALSVSVSELGTGAGFSSAPAELQRSSSGAVNKKKFAIAAYTCTGFLSVWFPLCVCGNSEIAYTCTGFLTVCGFRYSARGNQSMCMRQ